MTNSNIHKNGIHKNGNDDIMLEYSNEKCREMLRELGFDTCNSGPLTREELRILFIYEQEDIFIGS